MKRSPSKMPLPDLQGFFAQPLEAERLLTIYCLNLPLANTNFS